MSKWIGLGLTLIACALLWSARGEAASIGCKTAAYEREGLVRVVYGCEGRTLTAASYYPAMLDRIGALLRIAANRRALSPMEVPLSQVYPDEVDLCDRYQLWAQDEGARAPLMTRQQKISQACK